MVFFCLKVSLRFVGVAKLGGGLWRLFLFKLRIVTCNQLNKPH